MNIVVTSIVRNGTGYLSRYVMQVEGLARYYEERGDSFTLAVCEGDSTDDTVEWLQAARAAAPFEVLLCTHNHGGPVFGSVNDATRWRNIAATWNYLYATLATGNYVRGRDVVVYVEADLVWTLETMQRLIQYVADGIPAVSPMSFLRGTSVFYDTWGHRGMDYGSFSSAKPYHKSLEGWESGLVQIRSAGSCMVMRGEIARKCRFSLHDAMLGHSIYENDYTLWLDPALRVDHP